MKKMLAKAVVLGLVLGGIGFVANDAQAADIGDGVKVHSGEGIDGTGFGQGHDIKTEKELGADAVLAEQKDLVKVNEEVATNKANIQTNADAIKANGDAIKANGEAIKANGEAISAETGARKNADDKLDEKIGKNTEAINKEVTERKAEVARLDGEVARLDSKIDKLDARVEKVGAMAAAIANLHTMGYDPEAPTEIAVGVGQYRDKTGMALGAFHYPNRDFMLSFSVSTAGDEYMGGIGATWKFGRKTPEELRQAEAEKAAKAKLAKAEAAKKAAKDARVAAQQKRHAEMLAARTAK